MSDVLIVMEHPNDIEYIENPSKEAWISAIIGDTQIALDKRVTYEILEAVIEDSPNIELNLTPHPAMSFKILQAIIRYDPQTIYNMSYFQSSELVLYTMQQYKNKSLGIDKFRELINNVQIQEYFDEIIIVYLYENKHMNHSLQFNSDVLHDDIILLIFAYQPNSNITINYSNQDFLIKLIKQTPIAIRKIANPSRELSRVFVEARIKQLQYHK